MEDIVGFLVTDRLRGVMGFMTWGRLFDAIDEIQITEWVRKDAERTGLHDIESVSVCESLSEVATCKYFYESFFAMVNEGVPFGDGYEEWASLKREAIRGGGEIYFLQALNRQIEG